MQEKEIRENSARECFTLLSVPKSIMAGALCLFKPWRCHGGMGSAYTLCYGAFAGQ